MIRHVVWWKLKNHAKGRSKAENIAHIQRASAMLHGLPSLEYVEISAKIMPSSCVEADIALMSVHKTMDDLEAYRADPVHLEFARQITELAESRNCVDYSFESNLAESEKR